MYAHVAVAKAQDPKKSFYTYFIDRSLPLGTLVTVPFGRQISLGIVMAVSQTSDFAQVLPIVSVHNPKPFLTPQQLALMTWLATYYQTSLSSLVPLILPAFTKKTLASQQESLKMSRNLHAGQTLILVPDHHKRLRLSHELDRKQRSYLVYEGDQPPAQRAQTYLTVLRHQPEVILATRIGLFLPFTKLSRIYLYDDHNWSYKEHHTPTFHATTVAQQLAALWHIPLTIIDQTPRVQTWYQARKQPSLSIKRPPNRSYRTVVINLANEAKKGIDGPLAAPVLTLILKAVLTKRPILLYLNKKNDGGTVHCQSCRNFSYVKEAPVACPVCGSTAITVMVVNLKRVALQIHKAIRGLHAVPGLWQTTQQGSFITFIPQPGNATSHLEQKQLTGKPLITIATQKAFYLDHAQPYAVVVVVSADALLQSPEFRTTEKAFATFSQLLALAQSNALVVIQTKEPDHFLFDCIRTMDYERFATQEIPDRKTLAYPPFTELILLSYAAKTKRTAFKHAQALYDDLREEADDTVTIGRPFAPLYNPDNARILLRATNHDALRTVLALIPSNWRIDFDPEDIVT